jgi:transposase
MSSTTIHRKANGVAYVYSVESYWDKEKKAPRNKQVCLGRLNEETGEIIPSKRMARLQKEETAVPPEFQATAKVCGPHSLLMKLAKDAGLTSMLKKVFPDTHAEILSLASFITQKGLALSRCEMWSENNEHPCGHRLSSQRVSEILKSINENDRQHFLSLWLKRLSEKEMLCYDTTSVSSYAKSNEYVRYGKNKDNEKLPQINLAMLFGQESNLPAHYRRIPGNINDVSTLEATMDMLDYLGKTKLQFVLDRGCYSEKNIDMLLDKRYHFFLMLRTDRVWVRNIIDKYLENITSPEHYRQTGEDEALFMVSHLHQWGQRRCYVHLYYNASRAAQDYDDLIRTLVICKEELESEKLDKEHKELYERYFIVKRTPKRGLSVAYNEAEIQKYRKRYAGFFCIMTNVKMESEKVLEIYRRRDIVEKCFDDLKNALDMKRLRIHSSEAMDSRLFIQFIALILMSMVREVAKKTKGLKYMSVREIMEAMESVVRITYSGRYGSVITEMGPLQQNIIEAFGVELKS